MALLDSEIWKIKAELGYNVLTVGAEPYIGFAAIFDQIIKPYTSAGAKTTSNTAVTAETEPSPVTLALALSDGFTAGDRVAIDVDSRQEIATVQSLSGSNITVLLMKDHSGTYPVTVEAGDSIVRETLRHIANVKGEMGSTFGEGSLRKVDEVEFFQTGGSNMFGQLGTQLTFWREELAAQLGVESMWSAKKQGAQTLSVY